jgi:multiple sugar transport system substrate-binding protein
MVTKRWIVSVLLVVMLSYLLVGCSQTTGGGDKGSDSSGPVTVKISFYSGEISKEQIAEFEKENPGIKIEQIDADYNKLMAMMAAGNAPDIIRLYGATELPNFVIKGMAMDLSDRFKGSSVFKEDDFLPVVNLYKYDIKTGTQGVGRMYGFPKDWSQDFTIFYNKKIFDKEGIPYPSATEPMTWKQLIDLGKKLTKKEGDKVSQYGLVYYNGHTAANQDFLLLELAQMGKSIYSDDFGSSNWDTPEVKKILAQWADAVKSNIGPNPINQEATWGGNLFVNETAAMMITGYWYTGLLRGDEKAKTHLDDFGIAPAPIAEGGQRISPTGAATGAIIYSKTKHPDEAWKVFEWFLGGKPADDRAKSGWGLPSTKSKLELLPTETAFDKIALDFVNNEVKYAEKFIKYNPYIGAQAAGSLLDKHFAPVYFDKATVDEAVKNITKDMNLLIQEGKDIAGVK